MDSANRYTMMQKGQYYGGTSNHLDHNDNPDYWGVLLGDLKESKKWKNKVALDFACGKGRNVFNMSSLCEWERIDGIDLSLNNIAYCKSNYKDINSNWYCNDGVSVSNLNSDEYDFVMSTIALQHIPVYDIRRSILLDILRTLKPGGLFSFQMGFGKGLDDPFGREKSSYYENSWDATGTNSIHDVRIQSEEEIITDLREIGYTNISTVIKDSFSDKGHSQWIYIKCYKDNL
tara:strand:+ start:2672 stop:3367 length:696 start_codon:yes stop_codon:yes gene_type:complete